MKNKLFRRVTAVLLCFLILVPNTLGVLAANWNGGSVDSGVGDTSASAGGFAISTTWAGSPDTILALRFSYYNVDTGTTSGTIDVYRSAYASYMSYNKFSSKYNKLELQGYENFGFSATTSTAGCYEDTEEGISLPNTTSGLSAWQEKNDNINAILSVMGGSVPDTVGGMKDGDYLLVEPIYPVQIAGAWYVLTVTEMAVLGTIPELHQVDVDGNGVYDSNYTGKWMGNFNGWESSWQWIAEFANKAFPNTLYLEEDWVKANGDPVLASKKPTVQTGTYYTFDEIITEGYGIGIAWTNTLPNGTQKPETVTFTVNHLFQVSGTENYQKLLC